MSIFQPYFFVLLVIKTLAPDPETIRIDIQPNMLDPDPESMNQRVNTWIVVLCQFATNACVRPIALISG